MASDESDVKATLNSVAAAALAIVPAGAVQVLRPNDLFQFVFSHPAVLLYAGSGATQESVHPIIRGRFAYWRESASPDCGGRP